MVGQAKQAGCRPDLQSSTHGDSSPGEGELLAWLSYSMSGDGWRQKLEKNGGIGCQLLIDGYLRGIGT